MALHCLSTNLKIPRALLKSYMDRVYRVYRNKMSHLQKYCCNVNLRFHKEEIHHWKDEYDIRANMSGLTTCLV